MMNKKVTAMVLASVLASPVMMAKISMAGGLEFEKGFCLPPPAPGIRCPATATKGEAEVEYSQKTKGTPPVTKTKLSAEVEFKVPPVGGVRGTLPADPDITIDPINSPVTTPPTFGAAIICNFVNPPTVMDIFNTATPPVLLATKVEYEGSLFESTDPTAVLPANTLDCGTAALPVLLKGSRVTVTIGAVDVTGFLKLDH